LLGESVLHKVLDIFLHGSFEMTSGGIFSEFELDSYNQVDDFLINTIGPVVVQYFEIVLAGESTVVKILANTLWFPTKTMFEDEGLY